MSRMELKEDNNIVFIAGSMIIQSAVTSLSIVDSIGSL